MSNRRVGLPSLLVRVTVVVRNVTLRNEMVAPIPAVDVHWMTDLWFCGRIAPSENFLLPSCQPFSVSFKLHPLKRHTGGSSRCTASALPSCYPARCCGQRCKPWGRQRSARVPLTGSRCRPGATTTPAGGGGSSPLRSRCPWNRRDPRPEWSPPLVAGRCTYRTLLMMAMVLARERRGRVCQTVSPTLDLWR